MDFLKAFDARGAAETAREMTLRDQETGEIITNGGEPCIVLVKGASSRSVQAAVREEELARAKAKAARKDDGQVDTNTAEDLHKATCKAAARSIVGFKNIQTLGENGKPRDLTVDDVPAFLDLNFVSMAHLLRDKRDNEWRRPSFAQQVVEFAQDDAAFLGKSATA